MRYVLLAILAALIVVAGNLIKAQPIENELGEWSRDALTDNALGFASIEMDGRDAYVHGLAPNTELRDRALEIVDAVWGVRRAHDRMTLPSEVEDGIQGFALADITDQSILDRFANCQNAFNAALQEQSIQFAFDSVEIDPASHALLDRLAEIANSCPRAILTVAGHTDNIGTAEANRQLSLGRAQSVVDYMVADGISRSRMIARGYGFDRAIASNETAEGQAANRRVEITISGLGGDAQ
ncbi:OmpA family protein [Hyphobacterium sp.]|uniref:OmpA family protein n=1 Tax=Hyphobacterium sp. TaxID=2004662 RepID=UPI003BAA2CC3